MSRRAIGGVGALLLAGACAMAPTRAVEAAAPGTCIERVLPSGARALHCIPAQGWNGSLIVFAHGYTAVTEPLDFQNLHFADVYLPEVAQQLGFAFATTSYRQTGLTILEGVQDVRELVQQFTSVAGRKPRRVLLVGASEGGIVTALAIERYPQLFSGGLAMCGPIGNFRAQLDYIAGFRALFDYFYPGLLPGDALTVPQEVLDTWYEQYQPLVEAAVEADPAKAMELLGVARAPGDAGDFDTVLTTVDQVLWYQVFGSADSYAKLGGNPFDNQRTRYRGSRDDAALNAGVDRFAADPGIAKAVRPYETMGLLQRPLVTLHTTGDEVIPFWHEYLYYRKVERAGQGAYLHVIPVRRYGHCNFTLDEVLQAFLLLLRETRG